MLATRHVRAFCDPKSRDNAVVVARPAVETFVAFRRGVHLRYCSLADSATENEFWERQALRRRGVAGRFDGSHRDDAIVLMEVSREAMERLS